jgi:hypothetical protein
VTSGRPWLGRRGTWGPADGSSVVFGTDVVDDLVAGMESFLSSPRPSSRAAPAALGCVGWLTDGLVVQALLRFDACCIVVDKPGGQSPAERKLRHAGAGFSTAAFPRLADLQPRGDTGPAVVGPSSGWEPVLLEPLRVAGFSALADGVKPHRTRSCWSWAG